METVGDKEKSEHTILRDAVVLEKNRRSLLGLHQTRQLQNDISACNATWQKTTDNQRAGRVAEVWHAGTFNVDAAKKGSDLNARLNPNGHPADIRIQKGPSTVSEAQVKFCGRSSQTAKKVANIKYDNMQRVVPSDQVSTVKRVAQKRVDVPGKRNYSETSRTVSDKVHFEKVKSKPLSHSDALELAKDPAKKVADLMRGEMVGAIANGGKAGAVGGGLIAAATNVVSVAQGKTKIGQAILETTKQTASGAVSGVATTAASVGTQTLFVRFGLTRLAGSSAPGAVGMAAIDTLKDVGQFVTGKISAKQLVSRGTVNAVSGGASFIGTEAGAALGTMLCPGLGTMVGGVVGGFTAGLMSRKIGPKHSGKSVPL